MKFIHTFAKHQIDRTFLNVDRIAQFKIEVSQHAASGRNVPVEVVCYTETHGRHILTPTKIISNNDDLTRLSKFIANLILTLTCSGDGSIIQPYKNDESDWAIELVQV